MSEWDLIEERRNREGDTFRSAEHGLLQLRVRAARESSPLGVRPVVQSHRQDAHRLGGPRHERRRERLRWLLDDMRDYVEVASRHLDELDGKDRREERIKALRRIAGRTPEEAAAYLAKADQLERTT